MNFQSQLSTKAVKAAIFTIGVCMSSVVHARLCDPATICAGGYPTPRVHVEAFFDGKAFDHKFSYTPEVRTAIEADAQAIWDRMASSMKRSSQPTLTVSAGPPGTGKTTEIRKQYQDEGKLAGYICPDDVCLKEMPLTYKVVLEQRKAAFAAQTFSSFEERAAEQKQLEKLESAEPAKIYDKLMYDTLRPASNAITHAILSKLFREKFDIYYGTTSASPFTYLTYKYAKGLGYKVKVLHFNASDEVRWKSIQARNDTFVQTSEEDIIQKGDLVPQRIKDTFLDWANEIDFYYRDEVKSSATLAATWVKGAESENPTLAIQDKQRYEAIKKVHNAVCERLQRPDILWETAVEKTALIR